MIEASTTLTVSPLPWQQSIWKNLLNASKENRMPHALMFLGPKGVGKTHLAKALIQKLHCQSPDQDLAPCGKCRGCELMAAGTHPDFIKVNPEAEGKAIKVDQIRSMGQFLNGTSFSNGYKIVLINPTEAMNINASNALLKNLEEPAGKSLLILITHSISSVMPTIRSRCQVIRFQVPNIDEASQWLTEKTDDSTLANTLLMLASGAPLLAHQYFEEDRYSDFELVITGLIDLLQGNISVINLAQRWSDLELIWLVDNLLNWITIWIAALVGEKRTNLELITNIINILRADSLPRLVHFSDQLLILKKNLLAGNNPNRQLTIEMLLLDWVGISGQQP